MAPDVETIVVGAGVIGLAIARALVQRGRDVLILEANDGIGTQISSRNSEVIHAGIYYPTGSLRARFCVTGKELLYDFLRENGVPHKRIGKFIVANSAEETERLIALQRQANENGVDDLELLTGAAAKRIEPELHCESALYSPSSGIVDTHSFMLALEGHVTTGCGEVVLNTKALTLSRRNEGGLIVHTSNNHEISCGHLIIAAGLGAIDLMNTMAPFAEPYVAPTLYPAKGHYFSLQTKCPFQHLIYPMPTDAWLGIHLSIDMAGQAKFGPDLSWVDNLSYDFDLDDGRREENFTTSIRRYWPELPDNVLSPAYTGIRPKIYAPNSKPADFTIHTEADHGVTGLTALFGIETPGLTSSLAIADFVANIQYA